MPGRRANGEGSVYQTPTGWRANWSRPDGKRQYASGKTRAEAIANRNRKRVAYEQGLRAQKALRLGQLCDNWLETVVATGCRPRTWQEYHSIIRNHVKPHVGDLRVAEVEPQHLRDLYFKKLRTLAPATITKVHSVIRGALKMALTDRLVAYSVAVLVSPPSVPEYEARELSVVEVAQILVAIQGHRHGPIWAFLIGTGCRWGEAAGLTWSAVDADQKLVRVRFGHSRLPREFREDDGPGWEIADLKTRRSRRGLHLSGLVGDALAQQRGVIEDLRSVAGPRWVESDLVFPNTLGTPLRNDKVLEQWHTVMNRIGLEVEGGQPIRHHDLRRALATLVQDVGGGDVSQVRDILGHATIQTTADVYVGRLEDSSRRALDVYAAALEQAIRAAS